jgi:hypothetical protein
MQIFGFEHDPVPEFDPAAHGIDDSHCEGLRPKTEYRDHKTGSRLRFAPGSRWEEERNGTWVPVENPNYVEYVLMDDDSDAAFYLHCMSERHGERVSTRSIMQVEEPMRSALVHWAGLDKFDRDVSDCVTMWVSDEYGLVVTASQCWAYLVFWISREGLEKVQERVRRMKAEGLWEPPHPNGATAVFRTA